MYDLLNGDLKNVKVPYKEVAKFMHEMESGLVNSDNQEFYKDLNKADNFDELFKKYND